MRVTNQMMSNNVKNYIQENLSRLSRTQQQLSTGSTILKPSDSPTDISKLLSVKQQKEINNQYKQNINDGLSYLNTADAALGTAGDIMAQCNELAVQGANGTMTQEDMQALGDQVDKLIDEVIDVANSTAGGKYIFAGRDNDSPPFRRPSSDVIEFHGDMQRIKREIASMSEHMVDAPSVLDDSSAQPGVFGKVDQAVLMNSGSAEVGNASSLPEAGSFDADEKGLFNTMFKLRDLLNQGESGKLSDFIDKIQAQRDNVLEYRTKIGARTRHFESVKEQMTGKEIRLTQVMENIESADISKLSIELSEQQMTYQASMAAGSRMLQTSLLNFLK
ncbi:MAG: flagellar hook-associated protein FlgL [Clostridiales bacterium]|nr:flagellar hook-associated protein FlgL [Clostridiales bacterium]MCF8021764.1 flagellar hook-associated protein FlgL [Clostridiales bacterium]